VAADPHRPGGRASGRRLLVRRPALTVVLLVVLVALLASPPVRLRLSAGAAIAEAIGLTVPRPFAAAVTVEEVTLGGVVGDLYSPGVQAPPVLFLPGAAPRGRADARVAQAATAVAASDRLVFVPELTLYDRRLDEDDLDRIVGSTLALVDHDEASGPAVILGFSFGGSLGLVAAADPRLDGHLAQVASFGAYADLVGLIQAATTRISVVGGERMTWEPDPMAEEIVVDAAVDLVPRRQRTALRRALEGERHPDRLADEARAVHDLVVNDDPLRTPTLARRVAPEVRERLARFSPATVIDDVVAPVVLMHATDDPAVPFAELRRFQRVAPDARVVVVSLFDHVDAGIASPRALVRLPGDVLGSWRFATWVMEAQD
jgi:pimeloyl-ACP methyl ester carboxylesterase